MSFDKAKGKKYDYLFKFLIIGESGVGKTCLLLRFSDDSFTNDHLLTIGIDFKIKIIEIGDYSVKLQIWDTAGQERFRTITKTYYKGANGIILTYDVTDELSFKNLKNWLSQIESSVDQSTEKILVGNKCDLENRKISYEDGEKLALEYGLKFYETSAKNNYNVTEVFNTLTTKIIKNENNRRRTDTVILKNKEQQKNEEQEKKCCK